MTADETASVQGEGRRCHHKGDRGECLAPDCNCPTARLDGVPAPSDQKASRRTFEQWWTDYPPSHAYAGRSVEVVTREAYDRKVSQVRAATLREVAPLCEFVESLAAEDPATVSKYHAIGVVLLARHALAAHFNQEDDKTT